MFSLRIYYTMTNEKFNLGTGNRRQQQPGTFVEQKTKRLSVVVVLSLLSSEVGEAERRQRRLGREIEQVGLKNRVQKARLCHRRCHRVESRVDHGQALEAHLLPVAAHHQIVVNACPQQLIGCKLVRSGR